MPLDYFRVPYEVVAGDGSGLAGSSERHPLLSCEWLRAKGQASPVLYWPSYESVRRLESLSVGAHSVDSIPLHGHVLPDSLAAEWLRQAPGAWRKSTPIYDAGRAAVASVWKGPQGATFLPFDPEEVIQNYWTEAYQTLSRPSLSAWTKGRRGYYRVRPLLPRAAQIWMRQRFTRVQARARFPRWPTETALHDLYAFVFRAVAGLVTEPVPWLSAWPRPYSWAFVLTHDVETSVGYQNLHLLRDIEVAAGYRSSWHFVPSRDYRVDDALVRELTEDGFEVGVHGLYHDGRDMDASTYRERFPLIRQYAERWNATGFRSPSTLRNSELIRLLGFDHDSSYSDTAPFEPQPGGCCSWLPYMNEDLVELPITLPQDQTVFELLRLSDESMWVEKAQFLRSRGGMSLLLTHPDYLPEGPLLDAYRRILDKFAPDLTAWKCLPRDVSAWWRRRAASRLERVGREWQIVGPAAHEGTISSFSATEPFGSWDKVRESYAAYL